MYVRQMHPTLQYNPGGGRQSFSILGWDESRLYEDYYDTYENLGDPLFSLEDTMRLGLCLPFFGGVFVIHFCLFFLVVKYVFLQ